MVTGYLTEFLMRAFPWRHCTAGHTPRWELCNRGKLPSSTSYKIVSLEATTQQPSPTGPLTGARALTLHTGGRRGHREPLQHSHSQTSQTGHSSILNRQIRRNDTHFTVAWAWPGTTGQDRKYFGPRSASGVPKRARQELSWRHTASAQSTVLHTGSQGEGTWPLNWRDRQVEHRHWLRRMLRFLLFLTVQNEK